MKILAVSDVVNRRLYSPYVKELASQVDLLVSCGDLPDYYLDFLVSNLCKPLLYVCGNHDRYEKRKAETGFFASNGYMDISLRIPIDYDSGSNFGGINMDNRIEKINNIIFAGLEGSVLYNYGEHQYTQGQMRRKIFRLLPGLFLDKLLEGRFIDVLITHAPPWGIHDRKDRAHQGFKPYLDFIKRYHPKYLLHGHTHIYDNNEKRVEEYMGTKIINCYDYQIFDIGSGK